MPVATASQGWRFVRGLRRFLREPMDEADARAELARRMARRDDRLLETLDATVWSHRRSPFLPLLAAAGFERDSVVRLVRGKGVEGALEELRDAGVYVTYEEFLGREPIRRGSTVLGASPADFFSPVRPPDYMGSSSGTRSGGTPTATNFVSLRRAARAEALLRAVWEVADTPAAVWLPVLPSAAGLNNVLRLSVTGAPTERWFSHVDPRERGITLVKQLANRAVPVVGRTAGVKLPYPEHVTAADPGPVLDWCHDALGRAGRALLVSYPSSAVALAGLAVRSGLDLSGLVIRLGGEPATPAKVNAIRAAGARPANAYAFSSFGRLAMACPECSDEELHLLEPDVAVIGRDRQLPSGATVSAVLVTSLSPEAPSALLNVENDDYADLSTDEVACSCLLGSLGVRRRISRIRGMSKVVSGGVTVLPGVLERLAEQELPARFGGMPTDYQFAEQELDGSSVLAVRVHPSVGPIDEAALVELVGSRLRQTDAGVLAEAVWGPAGAVRVQRVAPVAGRAGKLMAFEPLR